jgi:hypothetical protein
MKHQKVQPSIILLTQVVSRLTLASLFSIGSLIGLNGAFAATQTSTLPETGISIGDETGTLTAQANATLLNYETANYAVRVFTEGGETLMNVFQKPNSEFPEGLLRLSRAPATFTIRDGKGVYISTGSYSGRQARYIAELFANDFARLVIIDGSNQVIASQDATRVVTFNIPDDLLAQAQQTSILNFETTSYSVRVFERDNNEFMNVFNKFTGDTEINGQPANLVPNESAVRYVSSGQRSGQPVEYVAQLEGNGEAAIIIQNVNGQQLFRDQATGPITINPQPDWPIAVNGDGEIGDAFVAAVFGGEETLARVRAIYPSAFFDTSARQGRFINAGSFASQEAAQIRVLELRSEGFNSRLVFRDVLYR